MVDWDAFEGAAEGYLGHASRRLGRPPGKQDNGPRPLPPEPTRADPGSDEKINIMRWRVANGYSAFHPEDAR